MQDYLATEFASNSLQTWFVSLVIACITFLALAIIRQLSLKKSRPHQESQHTLFLRPWLNILAQTQWVFILLLSLYAGILVLNLPGMVNGLVHSAMIIALIIQSGMWVSVLLNLSMSRYRQRQLENDPASATTLNLLNFIARVVLWAVVLLLVLDNLGINITALVAGLGVGGIAVALAVQNILGDLFASLSIVLDKPFVIGDFIIVDDYMGSVEYVGLKTTRLRSLSGEQLVFSNSDLLNSRIRNYGRMFERRVSFNIGVTYQTPRDKIELIPKIIRTAIESQDKTRFDRAHFKEYGDFSLNFESVYYVKGPDYNEYMDIQQAINLDIHKSFSEQGIEFAFPTQTILLQNN